MKDDIFELFAEIEEEHGSEGLNKFLEEISKVSRIEINDEKEDDQIKEDVMRIFEETNGSKQKFYDQLDVHGISYAHPSVQTLIPVLS